MDECIFCKIVEGTIPSHRVYEDDDVIAFLEINPASLGHTLVIPKEHAETIYDLSLERYGSLMRAAKSIGNVLSNLYKPRRVGLLAYGFDVAHAHLHLIPLHDGSEVIIKRQDNPDKDTLAVTAEKISASL